MKTLALDFVDGNSNLVFYLPEPVQNLEAAIERLTPLERILPIQAVGSGWIDLPHTVRRRYRVTRSCATQHSGTQTIPVKILLESTENVIGFQIQMVPSDRALGRLTLSFFNSFLPVGLYLGEPGGQNFRNLRTNEVVEFEAQTPSADCLTYLVCLNFVPKAAN